MNSNARIPAIDLFLYAQNQEYGEIIAREICLGIEEEGLFSRVTIVEENMNFTEFSAMVHSRCEVNGFGVAVGVYDEKIVVHEKKMDACSPVMNAEYRGEKKLLRIVGRNAASLIKVQPFLFL